MGWQELAAASPGPDTFPAVFAAVPTELKSADLPDLIVASDRLISALQAVQMAAVAEFARPGRAGNLDRSMDKMTDKAGAASTADGSVDPELLQELLVAQARVLAGVNIAAMLHQSPVGAAHRVDAAMELVDELPETLSALRDGLIDVPRARVIAERTQNPPPEHRRRVQVAALGLAGSRTPGQLIPLLDRRVIAVDPEAAWKRCQRARKDRRVKHHPGVDGLATIKAYLSAENAVSVFELLDRMAQATAGQDGRSVGARRADALVDIFVQLWTTGGVEVGGVSADTAQPGCSVCPRSSLRHPTDVGRAGGGTAVVDEAGGGTAVVDEAGGGTAVVDEAGGGTAVVDDVVDEPEGVDAESNKPAMDDRARAETSLPRGGSGDVSAETGARVRLSRVTKRHGRPTHFNLTMSLEAFLGLSDDPAELAGHGLIPAQLARSLRASAKSFAVVVVDDKGHALGVGSTAYVPNQMVTDQVITAAGTCRVPSCRIPAARCDLDHREPFDHEHPERGGLTDPACLDPECRKHHVVKTHTGWSAERDPRDGLTMVWTSPTGHRYSDHPREFTLPDVERLLLRVETNHPPARATSAGESCWCECCHHSSERSDGAGEQAAEVARQPTQGELTRELIERKAKQEQEAEELAESQRLNLRADPVWMYRLGMPEANRSRNAERQQEDDDFDPADYVDYEPPTEAFMRRFCPRQYEMEQAAAYRAAHPDPDLPPF